MITVAGEALMDVIADAAGTFTPFPGGAPFNVAVNVARLGADCAFLGRLSDDPFGARLRAELLEAGVLLAAPHPVSAPTTLAIAQLDQTGSADYRFYFEATSAAALTADDVPGGLLGGGRALALGGLGIVYEPMRSTLLALVDDVPPDLLVVLDPNCRPRAIPDLDSYRATVASLITETDVLKVSVQDIELLFPGSDPVEYGIGAAARGPAVVLITDGPGLCVLITADGVRHVAVPAVEVVDTIGAGDAFVAGLLAWFARHPEVDPRDAPLDVLQGGVESAIEVAGAVCQVRGAVLPEGFSWTGGSQGAAP